MKLWLTIRKCCSVTNDIFIYITYVSTRTEYGNFLQGQEVKKCWSNTTKVWKFNGMTDIKQINTWSTVISFLVSTSPLCGLVLLSIND